MNLINEIYLFKFIYYIKFIQNFIVKKKKNMKAILFFLLHQWHEPHLILLKWCLKVGLYFLNTPVTWGTTFDTTSFFLYALKFWVVIIRCPWERTWLLIARGGGKILWGRPDEIPGLLLLPIIQFFIKVSIGFQDGDFNPDLLKMTPGTHAKPHSAWVGSGK